MRWFVNRNTFNMLNIGNEFLSNTSIEGTFLAKTLHKRIGFRVYSGKMVVVMDDNVV